MQETKLYFIRHGESQANARNVFLGHYDLDLTDKGRAQAMQTAKFLQTVGADVIYASDLLRAYHTAKATADVLNLPVHKDERLREIYCGKWENMPFSELQETYKENYGVWLTNIGLAKTDGGESVAQLQERIVSVVKEIAENNQGKTVLIFTHATPVRCFAGYCQKKSLDTLKEIPWASNASVTQAIYKDGEFTLIEYSKDDFLGEIKTVLPKNV